MDFNSINLSLNKIEFDIFSAEDFCLKVADGTHDSPKETEFGKKLVTSKNIIGGSLNLEKSYYISIEDYNEINKRSKVDQWDILLSMIGTVGEVALIKEEPDFAIKNVGLLKNNNEYDAKWIYYYLKSNLGQYQIKSRLRGTTQMYIPLKDIRKLEIPVPKNKDYQLKIIKILDTIDQKIDNCISLNDNLFNIASLLQTEWMVNFTPFKSEQFKSSAFGLIPENWEVGKLGDVIELLDSKRVPLSGQDRENMEKIYPYYGAASLMDYVEDYIFDGVYLLMGEDGTVVNDKGFPILQYVWGKFWVNNHAHILKGKNGFNVESLYLLLSKTNIQSIVTGAVQAKVNQSNLKSIEIIIPPIDVIEKFNNLIKPLFDTIRSNNDEIKKLQKLRDTLLPKLMSGEIDVSEINCDLKYEYNNLTLISQNNGVNMKTKIKL